MDSFILTVQIHNIALKQGLINSEFPITMTQKSQIELKILVIKIKDFIINCKFITIYLRKLSNPAKRLPSNDNGISNPREILLLKLAAE